MGSNSEDLFIKPGNQERGWNDPPQFSYGLQTRGAHRNMLTRRAPPAGSGTPAMGSGTPPMTSALTPPKSSVAPPSSSAVPPPIGSSLAMSPVSCPIRPQGEPVQSEPEPDVEEVMSVLNAALEACRQNSKHTSAQVCSDMAKRLTLFENCWRSCRLSSVVRRRMKKLSSDLKSGLWDTADETHRSLMVDHVTEVSQWMVGIKRLIAETRKLSPDQLRPLTHNSSQDVNQDPKDPGLHSTGQEQNPEDPTLDPVGQDQETMHQTPEQHT